VFHSLTAFSSFGDSIELRLLINKEIKTADDLTIVLTIKSLQNRLLKIPRQDEWGVIGAYPGFLMIQVQKKGGNKYVNMQHLVDRIDNIPLVDIDTLFMNQERTFKFRIGDLYHYGKGQYRIRVLCTFADLNPIKDTYTKWAYFICDTEIKNK